MKAKDKAEELIEKFGIEKALLCVDEILDLGLLYGDAPFGNGGKQFYSYWKQVKQEILNRQ